MAILTRLERAPVASRSSVDEVLPMFATGASLSHQKRRKSSDWLVNVRVVGAFTAGCCVWETGQNTYDPDGCESLAAGNSHLGDQGECQGRLQRVARKV